MNIHFQAFKTVQNNLTPILKRLSENIDTRTVRNIGTATIGIINSQLEHFPGINFFK